MRFIEPGEGLPARITAREPMSRNRTADWRSQRPVIRAEDCTGCLICWKFCPEACVELTDKVPQIDLAHCKGCAVCAAECPAECIEMKEESAA